MHDSTWCSLSACAPPPDALKPLPSSCCLLSAPRPAIGSPRPCIQSPAQSHKKQKRHHGERDGEVDPEGGAPRQVKVGHARQRRRERKREEYYTGCGLGLNAPIFTRRPFGLLKRKVRRSRRGAVARQAAERGNRVGQVVTLPYLAVLAKEILEVRGMAAVASDVAAAAVGRSIFGNAQLEHNAPKVALILGDTPLP